MASDAAEELPEQLTGPDPWAGLLPGQVTVPAYLTSPYAAQYRLIVDVLLEGQDTSLTGMSFDELRETVHAALVARFDTPTADRLADPEGFPLEARLDRLTRWQVLTRWQEPARSGEDFLRRRDRYQLTPLAARLHAFWAEVDGGDETDSDLTLAPRAVRERLEGFAQSVTERRYQSAATEFQQLISLHQAMARAARSWQRSLAHGLAGAPEEAKQDAVRQTLHAYVAAWGEQVDTHSPRVAALLAELDTILDDGTWRACARSSLGDGAAEGIVDATLARWEQTWEALSAWFCGGAGQARRLRRQLRDVIAPWARNMNILMDTGGAVTRRAELLRLATSIERAPDEHEAWRIWDTAVGGFAARHLLLAADAPDDAAASWRTAPAAPVTARFWEHGHRAGVGRRTRRPDYSTGRDAARRARTTALAARREAEAALRHRSGTSLSTWDPLNGPEFDLLLELLGAARLAGPDRSGMTRDGRWRVTLRPPPDPADTTAVQGPHGEFVTVDWRLDLEPAT